MMLRRCGVVAVVLSAGCVEGEHPPESVRQDAIGGDCQEFMCGTNSPQIAELGFWELNLPRSLDIPGQPNNVGLQILGFVKNNQAYLPTVFGGRLTASRPSAAAPHDTITISGNDLVGGWFSLQAGRRQFRLRVSEVDSVDSWAQPPSGSPHVTLESYLLDWSELASNDWTEFRNLRRDPANETTDALTMTGRAQRHTLLFEGDRIDAARKLDTGVDTSWINLGIAGSALAKLALTGHTEAARNAATFDTTLTERQAMLKLLVADYCGDGTPFTVAGQPLQWRDDRGTMSLAALSTIPAQPLVLESRWTADGAACLDQPRLDAHWTALGAQTFGADVYEQVQRHCPAQVPPPCADGFDAAGYHLVSATVPLAASQP